MITPSVSPTSVTCSGARDFYNTGRKRSVEPLWQSWLAKRLASFINTHYSSATFINTRQLIHSTTHTKTIYNPKQDDCSSTVYYEAVFIRKKPFAGTRIWTHNLLTRVFLAGHHLSEKSNSFIGSQYSGGPLLKSQATLPKACASKVSLTSLTAQI